MELKIETKNKIRKHENKNKKIKKT